MEVRLPGTAAAAGSLSIARPDPRDDPASCFLVVAAALPVLRLLPALRRLQLLSPDQSVPVNVLSGTGCICDGLIAV